MHPDNKNVMKVFSWGNRYGLKSKIITYLPAKHFATAAAFIDSLLLGFNTSKIEALLLLADPCPAKDGVAPCERHHFPAELVTAWRAMEEAKRAGKVETLGVSDLSLSVSGFPVLIFEGILNKIF